MICRGAGSAPGGTADPIHLVLGADLTTARRQVEIRAALQRRPTDRPPGDTRCGPLPPRILCQSPPPSSTTRPRRTAPRSHHVRPRQVALRTESARHIGSAGPRRSDPRHDPGVAGHRPRRLPVRRVVDQRRARRARAAGRPRPHRRRSPPSARRRRPPPRQERRRHARQPGRRPRIASEPPETAARRHHDGEAPPLHEPRPAPHAISPGSPAPASLPLRGRSRVPGEVAQLVEHTTENRGVAGSNPALATQNAEPLQGCFCIPQAVRPSGRDERLGKSDRTRPRIAAVGLKQVSGLRMVPIGAVLHPQPSGRAPSRGACDVSADPSSGDGRFRDRRRQLCAGRRQVPLVAPEQFPYPSPARAPTAGRRARPRSKSTAPASGREKSMLATAAKSAEISVSRRTGMHRAEEA